MTKQELETELQFQRNIIKERLEEIKVLEQFRKIDRSNIDKLTKENGMFKYDYKKIDKQNEILNRMIDYLLDRREY